MMKFGRYYIGQDFSEIAENAEEISTAHKAVHLKEYEDEVSYEVDNAYFCDALWGTIVLISRGKVCQICMQTADQYLDRSLTSDIFSDILNKFLNDSFPNILFQHRQEEGSITAWDAPWGNVNLIKAIVGKDGEYHDEYTLTITGGDQNDNGRRKKSDPFMEFLIGLSDFSTN